MTRAVMRFGLAALVLIGASGLALAALYREGADRRAILVSAVVAFVVQLAAFAVVRRGVGKLDVIAAWGLGMGLRFAMFAVYALVVVELLALPSAAALISLATFFFVSTLVEPPFLKP